MLNLPIAITERIKKLDNILLLGCGGSDILYSLPLYYTLLKQGKKVHFANLTNTDFKTINEFTDPIMLTPNLLGATSMIKQPISNYIEGYLSNFFKVTLNQEIPIWMLNKTSVLETKKNLEKLIEHFKIESIFLIDGSVNSFMCGDESKIALTKKFVDTTLLLSVIQQIDSLEDLIFSVSCNNNNTLNYNIINKNISNLSIQGGFYGGCFPAPYMNSYNLMKSAYFYCKSNNNSYDELDFIFKEYDNELEDQEQKFGLMNYLVFNSNALAYNNIAVHKIIEMNSYYDIVQVVAPYVV